MRDLKLSCDTTVCVTGVSEGETVQTFHIDRKHCTRDLMAYLEHGPMGLVQRLELVMWRRQLVQLRDWLNEILEATVHDHCPNCGQRTPVMPEDATEDERLCNACHEADLDATNPVKEKPDAGETHE